MLTKERKGEIAYAAMKYRLSQEGALSLNRDTFKRELGKLSKAINIPVEELAEFSEGLVRDLVEETFQK